MEISKNEIDQDTVDKLQKSIQIVGHLGEVIKDQEGTILSGRHRKLADPDWPEKEVMVTDPLQRELLIVHYNVQRTVSKEETQRRLLNIAKILESTGIPKNEICTRVAELVPYTPQYVRELLPDEYKMQTKAREISGDLTFAKPVSQTAHERMDAALNHIKEAGEKLTRPTDWVRCEGEACNILTKATPEHIHEGKVLCSACLRKAGAIVQPPRKTARSLQLPPEEPEEVQAPQGPESPEIDEGPEEPEMKWRSTITMKKPHSVKDWLVKPDEETVLEEFADAIHSGKIDKLFEITIEEIAE